ncbi:MAG: hypothetical protein EOP45_14800 [Sphingobacteriaceae bacterium]|nr:MAG: hypothetical protein EOP45_14800 [Sphingobacteriaceae bacterium]
MNNDKQQAAEAIKRRVSELQLELDKAEQVGLTVKLTPPNKYSLANTGKLEVEIWEEIKY